MKLNIFTRIIVGLLFLGSIISSCSEDYLVEEPPHIIAAESLYESVDGFENGLNGMYSLVRKQREGRNGPNYLLGEIMMNGNDNLCTNHADGFARVAQQWGERNNPTNWDMVATFDWAYEIVNAANTLIHRAEQSDINWAANGMTAEENKNRILAEAHAIRAWAYRHLAFLWGDVPLSLEESKGSNVKTDWQRAPVEEVWAQVKKDLLFSEKYLAIEPSVEGKISKGAVQHYLAELYLVGNQPDSALFWANKCIDTPEYQLITERYGVKSDQPGVPFMDMFYPGNTNRSEGNTESLWTWQYEFEIAGGGGSIMRRWHISRYNDININGVTPLELTFDRGGRPRARMALTKFAIDLYAEGDDRGSQYAVRKFYILKDADQNDTGKADQLPEGYNYGDTIKMDWSEDITYETRNRRDWPHSRKWEVSHAGDVNGNENFNDQAYLRLADTYLLKAEAQLKLGDEAGAAETINVVRRRANAPEISSGDVDIDFILDERSRELVVEEERRYTLLRTGKWLERTRLYNHNGGQYVTERDKLFPIPQKVIDANLTYPMEQNTGY